MPEIEFRQPIMLDVLPPPSFSSNIEYRYQDIQEEMPDAPTLIDIPKASSLQIVQEDVDYIPTIGEVEEAERKYKLCKFNTLYKNCKEGKLVQAQQFGQTPYISSQATSIPIVRSQAEIIPKPVVIHKPIVRQEQEQEQDNPPPPPPPPLGFDEKQLKEMKEEERKNLLKAQMSLELQHALNNPEIERKRALQKLKRDVDDIKYYVEELKKPKDKDSRDNILRRLQFTVDNYNQKHGNYDLPSLSDIGITLPSFDPIKPKSGPVGTGFFGGAYIQRYGKSPLLSYDDYNPQLFEEMYQIARLANPNDSFASNTYYGMSQE